MISKQLFSALNTVLFHYLGVFCLMCLTEGVKYLSMTPIPLLLPLISFKCQMWQCSCRLCHLKCSRLSRLLNVGFRVDDKHKVQAFSNDYNPLRASFVI